MGPEFQTLEGYDHKSNVYKDRPRIPKFGRIRSEFQSLKGQDNNSNAFKNEARIPLFGRRTSEN